jgi:hypothetical protein
MGVIEAQVGDPNNGPIVYQVDLFGSHAALMRGQLSNMVETACCQCRVLLLAEGDGFYAALKRARNERRTLLPVCPRCLKSLTGSPTFLERNIPADYRHEEEFAAVLAKLKGRRAD